MKRTDAPHQLRLSDRVYQRLNPWQTGIVTKLSRDVSFTVTYDQPDRKPGQLRVRYTYPWGMMSLFLVGNPPEVDTTAPIPIPVNVEAFSRD